ncbi:pectate lyase [Leeuwenhoekiella marinoflava]|uniref:PelA/Pel-15E family pectate lyase n=2 Tax=Leeuwenhoekiella marinoflava TaxID=988 RepID=A0A4Q0PNZ5_9FLAO|nr:pectate lyase [Leeuwenhoekiella marinoflava]RXG32260.1 PelA/Pel-15E family pectate lyase [Leeuwenhoekiella marinoflava]SHE81475.1 pectate lyase, PelA/Pel-15E family [Leeuwenhoekiella marinoflava DSM 3653]
MKGRFIIILILSTIQFSAVAQSDTVDWHNILRQKKSWYSTGEAKQIGSQVLHFQYDNGGWAKNIEMAEPISKSEIAKLKTKQETTIDNGATIKQLRFLKKMIDQNYSKVYIKSFKDGVAYLLEAQYENGGWPQFYPLKKGYYTHITFNDNAMIGVLQLLYDINNTDEYTYISEQTKSKIAVAIEKGVAIILELQIELDGELTVWCAQHDEKTLEPAKARAYELPSLSGGESVEILDFLMQFENPSDRMITAIEAGVNWFKTHSIEDKEVKWINIKTDTGMRRDRVVVEAPGAEALWARFYSLETQQPIFVGRDGIIKDNLADIEYERRTGYSYIRNYAERLLKKDYPEWKLRLKVVND